MMRQRVNEIDLLRFIAALVVVFFHYTFRGYAADNLSTMPYPWLINYSKYGYLGVELFFMISGFVILMTAANGSLRSFVVSRLVRLYPAFWACCTISFIIISTIGAPRFSASVGQYLINMTMLGGFIGTQPIDGSYWSLFVEIRFYCLIVLVLLIRKIKYIQSILSIWLLASIGLEILPIGRLRDLFISDYSGFFIAGSTYYIIWASGFSIIRMFTVILAWGLSISQSLGRTAFLENHYATEINSYVVSCIVTAFFVVMLMVSGKKMGVIGRMQWTSIGALTYPLYLLHQNIGYILFNTLYPAINQHILLLGVIVGLIGISFVVYKIIEKPLAAYLKISITALSNSIELLIPKNRNKSRMRVLGMTMDSLPADSPKIDKIIIKDNQR